MPGTVPPVTDERDGLLRFLAQQRLVIRSTLHGLTEEQARSRPTVSELTLLSLVRHVALMERGWVAGTVAGIPEAQQEDQGFELGADDTIASVVALYDEVAAQTEALVAELDLDAPVPVPDAPWFPKDVEAWSVRWVLLHCIEETSRHAGHADILRECVDGATGYFLQMQAEDAGVVVPHHPMPEWAMSWGDDDGEGGEWSGSADDSAGTWNAA